MQIYLDMDGVLTDLATHIFQWHGVPYPNPWPKMEYNIAEVMGKDCWDLPTFFWSTMPKTKEFDAILRLLRNNKITICTCPTDHHSASGKLTWLKRNYPEGYDDFIICRDKSHLASRNVLLIDDCDEKVIKFRKAGGRAILFPRPWNSGYGITDPITKVKEQLKYYTD